MSFVCRTLSVSPGELVGYRDLRKNHIFAARVAGKNQLCTIGEIRAHEDDKAERVVVVLDTAAPYAVEPGADSHRVLALEGAYISVMPDLADWSEALNFQPGYEPSPGQVFIVKDDGPYLCARPPNGRHLKWAGLDAMYLRLTDVELRGRLPLQQSETYLARVDRWQIRIARGDNVEVLLEADLSSTRPSGGIGTKESELGFRILLWYATGKAPVPLDGVAEIVRLTQQPPPFEATHWTLRAMARAAGIAASTVQAIWKAHGLSPHRWRNFKLSTDPAFAEKLTDIVGLYVDPPAHAVVLSIDEKSQIQALDRRSADEEGTRRHHDP